MDYQGDDLDIQGNRVINSVFKSIPTASLPAGSIFDKCFAFEDTGSARRIAVYVDGVGWTSVGSLGEANTASNVGTVDGIGVFSSKVGVDLRLRKIRGNEGIEVSHDGTNDEIVVQRPHVCQNFNGSSNNIPTSIDFVSGYMMTNGNFQLGFNPASLAYADGLTFEIIAHAQGGNLRLEFPVNDFVQSGATQVDIIQDTAVILNFRIFNGRGYWTISDVMTQI
jgi:hypothetical protein